MGFKRRREHQEFRQRQSPAEEAVAKARLGIARVGEPSRFSKEGLMRGLVYDIGKVPEESWSQLLETIKAVVFEQPHKIGYLSFVISELDSKLSFLIVEMAQDELATALRKQDWSRFKLFLRFLCALHPIISNPEVLVDFIRQLVSKSAELGVNQTTVNTAVDLYNVALLSAIYLPSSLIDDDLRKKFAAVEFHPPTSNTFDCFKGENRPYEPKTLGTALVETAIKMNENNWEPKFLAENPLVAVKSQIETPNRETLNNEGPDGGESNNDEQNAPEDGASQNYQGSNSQANLKSLDVAGSEESALPENTDHDGSVAKNWEVASHDEAKNSDSDKEAKQTQHTVNAIHLPDLESIYSSVDQQTYFRCYLPIGNFETVPPESSVGGILLRDVSIDVMEHMDFNRREVVKQMIVLDEFFSASAFALPGASIDEILATYNEDPQKSTWKIEGIALEAIFSQIFDLRSLPHRKLPQVYFHSLLIEACIMAPQDIAPVLGRGLRFLFNHLESADAELFFNFVDWFAHHVSNFAFTWKWNEWLDSLQLPRNHPQLVFIRDLLSKQVRISYPQRVRDVLPTEFRDLVPNPPEVPEFKYSGDKLAEQFIEMLKKSSEQKGSNDQINDQDGSDELKDASYEPQEALSGDDTKKSTPKELLAKTGTNTTNLLIHVICHLGNRSVTHATTWIARVEDLLAEFAQDKAEIVNAVFEYWSQSPWVGALVLQQFIITGFLSPEHVINYIVSKQELLLTSVGWESLLLDVDTAVKALENVQIQGEYGEWWTVRLNIAVKRIKMLKDISSSSGMHVEEEGLPAPSTHDALPMTNEHKQESSADDVAMGSDSLSDEPPAKRSKVE